MIMTSVMTLMTKIHEMSSCRRAAPLSTLASALFHVASFSAAVGCPMSLIEVYAASGPENGIVSRGIDFIPCIMVWSQLGSDQFREGVENEK